MCWNLPRPVQLRRANINNHSLPGLCCESAGGIPGLAQTWTGSGQKMMDRNQPLVKKYKAYLEGQHVRIVL